MHGGKTKILERAMFIFLALGMGTSYFLQRDVQVGGRAVLERLPIPFWAYGVFLLLVGLVEVYALVKDNAKIMTWCLILSVCIWIGVGAGFGVSAVVDPVSVPFTGLVAFWFIALTHVIAVGVESSRDVINRGI